MRETVPRNVGGEPRRRRRDDGALVTGKFFQLGLAPQRGGRRGKLPPDSGAGVLEAPVESPLGMTLRFWEPGQQNMLNCDWRQLNSNLGHSRLVPELPST